MEDLKHTWKTRGAGLNAARVCAHCAHIAEDKVGMLDYCPTLLVAEVKRLRAPPRQTEAVYIGPPTKPSPHIFDGFVEFSGIDGDGGATVRDCLDCGCLVPGGPTRCKRCAREATAKRPA